MKKLEDIAEIELFSKVLLVENNTISVQNNIYTKINILVDIETGGVIIDKIKNKLYKNKVMKLNIHHGLKITKLKVKVASIEVTITGAICNIVLNMYIKKIKDISN